jgi:hypothetical protein
MSNLNNSLRSFAPRTAQRAIPANLIGREEFLKFRQVALQLRVRDLVADI